jgi:hypothetical protein
VAYTKNARKFEDAMNDLKDINEQVWRYVMDIRKVERVWRRKIRSLNVLICGLSVTTTVQTIKGS